MDGNTTTSASAGYGQPALVGGLVLGVLSALPIVNALNACCCLWVVIGGGVAAYLLQQNRPGPLSAGDGAIVGFLAGVIGAVVMFVLSIPIGLLIAPFERQMVERALSMSANLPPEVRRVLESYGEPRPDLGMIGQAVLRIVSFFFFLVFSTIFSTIGGLLGAVSFRKGRPAAHDPAASSL